MRPLITLMATAIAAALIAACSFFQASPSECIQAAEQADLPDEVINQLRDPDALNPIQQATLQQVLRRASIDDVCDYATNAQNTSSSTPPAGDHPSPTHDRQSDRHTEHDQDGDKPNITGSTSQINPPSVDHYHACLDEIFLRASNNFRSDHATAAAFWYCTELQPQPTDISNVDRCKITSISFTESQYPEWNDFLHRLAAAAGCHNDPNTMPATRNTPTGLSPAYTHCLDDVYLTHKSEFVAAWLCQELVPVPPDEHYQRCNLDSLSVTKDKFPEWPNNLHDWHAVMQCLPEWNVSKEPNWDAYDTCLADIYLQVDENYDKDTAIPAAVWRCRAHQPEPPDTYSARCILNAKERDSEDDQLPVPSELYEWRAIIKCFPAPQATN